jgi:hypothetical protein
MYAPLLYFVTLIASKCKFLRAVVLYVWISLLKLNICLLLIMYKTNEYIYTGHKSSLSPVFFKMSLQDSLDLEFVIILITFFVI